MGIRFACPNGHKLNVKEHLAGKRGICPTCGTKFVIPGASDTDGNAEPPPAAVATDFPVSRDGPPSMDANAPSMIISVIDSSSLAPEPAPATGAPPPAPPVAPTEFDFSAGAPAAAAAPVTSYAIRRARSRRLQLQIAVALFLAVIVLAIVLVWVLRRGPSEATPVPGTSTRLAPRASQAYVAEVAILVSLPRDEQVPLL